MRAATICAGGMMLDTLGESKAAGERYKRTGEILPDSAIEEFKKFDSIFLGAIGHPDVKPGILEVGILLKTRFALDQYINLRPVKLYPNVETPLNDKGPEHIDFVVVRENTAASTPASAASRRRGHPSSSPRRIGPRQEVAREFDEGRTVERARRDNSFVPSLRGEKGERVQVGEFPSFTGKHKQAWHA